MFLGKIRSRLRNRVTKRMLLAELKAVREELMAARKELNSERKARAALGDTVLRRLAQMEERYSKSFEGLEKNDMAILEAIDRESTRLREGIAALHLPAPIGQGDGEVPTEAQIKREWFGEDD